MSWLTTILTCWIIHSTFYNIPNNIPISLCGARWNLLVLPGLSLLLAAPGTVARLWRTSPAGLALAPRLWRPSLGRTVRL